MALPTRDSGSTGPSRILAAIVCAALLAISPAAAERQAPVPATADDVSRAMQSGGTQFRDGKLDAAIAVFERALADAERLGLERQQADALTAIGEALNRKTQYAAAREHALRALAIYERLSAEAGIARASLVLSIAADWSGEFVAEAESWAKRAMAAYEATGNRRGRALAALQLLRAARRQRLDEATLYEAAIADARAAGDRKLEGRVLHSRGDSLFTDGSYERAFEMLEQAAAIYQETDSRGDLGTVYNSIGRLYRAHGRVDEALRFQLKALELHQASGSPLDLMQSLNAVAVTHNALGNPRAARSSFERALGIAEKSSSPRIQDFVRSNLADTMMAEGDFAAAARTLEGVLARGLDAFPALRMRDLAQAYLGLGRRDEALGVAEKAVGLCSVSGELDCLYSMNTRSSVYSARGDVDAALADLRSALNTVERVRARLVPADFFKQRFHEALQDIYSRAIALQLQIGRESDALETAERARSRAFLDLLASKDLVPRPGDRRPDPQGDAPPSAAAVDGLPLTFRGTPTSEASRPKALTQPFDLPSEAEATAASTGDLAAAARRLQSTVVAYWVASDALYIWVIGAEGQLRTAKVDVLASRLAELVRGTSPFAEDGSAVPQKGQPAIATRGAASIGLRGASAAAWRELYRLLVLPVRDALPRATGSLLTIVPYGPLSGLAFAALQDERGRYLLEDYTLHYVPAGAVLPFTAARKRADGRNGRVLIVADPTPPTLSRLDAPLPRLPGARAEARAIARLMAPARVATLEGNTAGEAAVRAAVGGKAVLHFATHAVVRDDDPFNSFLALKPDADDVAGDGLLRAREIYSFDLQADLVVLSACRSAGGRVTGEGIATFARAFIYAGTPSLVASVWDVADEPTNRLLPQFYRAWFGGATKARALRTAQLRLLRELRGGKIAIETPLGRVVVPERPVFWAGFALFGEPG